MSATITEGIERVSVADLHPHPAAADVPKMCGAEWASFLADVGRRGVQEPLVVLEGTDLVLDGRHRLDAAEMSGAEDVPVRYVDLPEDEQVDYVIRAAICRRHLTDSQRALLAAKIATAERGRPKENGASCAIFSPTLEQAADLLNVSKHSAKRAKTIINQGDESLARAVESGDVTVSAAAKLSELPPDQQREAVAGGKPGVQSAVSRVARKAPKRKPEPKAPKLDLPAVKEAFMGLSEEDRMAFLSWVDQLTEPTIAGHSW